MQKFRKITIIWGDKQGRFPFSNSILIDDSVKVLIDTGAGLEKLNPLAQDVKLIINSHYHLDHIRFNHLFQEAEIIIHENDEEALASLKGYATKYGGELVFGAAWVDYFEREIKSQINNNPEQNFVYEPEFYKSIGKVNNSFTGGDQMTFGTTKVDIIHIPGHSSGHCCFLFRNQGLCFVTDYNVMSEFGPWYGGADSDIDSLLSSAEKLLELDAKFYLNSHDQRVFTKEEFKKGIKNFIGIVKAREEKIVELLDQGYTFYDLCEEGICYQKKHLVLDWVRIWEVTSLIKHLHRLNKHSLINDVIPLKPAANI